MLSNDEIRAEIAKIIKANPSTPNSYQVTMEAVKIDLKAFLKSLNVECTLKKEGWTYIIGVKYHKDLGNGYFMFRADCSPTFEAIYDTEIRIAKHNINEWVEKRCQEANNSLDPFMPRPYPRTGIFVRVSEEDILKMNKRSASLS